MAARPGRHASTRAGTPPPRSQVPGDAHPARDPIGALERARPIAGLRRDIVIVTGLRPAIAPGFTAARRLR
jgi:hypothetical protein